MSISDYYKQLRVKVGKDLIFMPSVAAIIRNTNDEILFQYPGKGEYWSLPAGAIEPGEAPAQALIREVWEETGLTVKPNKLLGIFGGESFRFTYPHGDQVEYNVFVFECNIISGKLTAIDGESVDLQFIKAENKPKLALPYPDFIFNKQHSSNVYFQWDNNWTKK
ncbi:ADP-ribose pyrophosphatase YjhB, NUDIX family [Psychrobacillus sp. OK028]|uniref:NUDIX hydrolase n=1 Tax=Psychrobacillus sp. OK028 TaxID=1884359 RepID=UPI0008891927|nr:NUDIX domain-containing protein [Psychrobacillus sp. OK028]SDO17437.1 ADP-ribose pyrophosphatase YjhB, NUDIX family [Psychrobacillus sp. OK028]